MSDDREQRNQVFRQGAPPDAGHGMPTQSTAEKLKQMFGIVVPAEVVRLPSEGKIYSADSGLQGRTEVEIKALTTREEDILTSVAYIKKGTAIKEAIRSCVVDKSIDVDQLVSGDRNALMVAIRITGYGAEYKAEIRCPECRETSVTTFDLSKLVLKPLGGEPIQPNTNEFEHTLPGSGAKATFKLLTGHDEEQLVAAQTQRKKALKSAVDTLMSDHLKASLLSVNDVRDRGKLAFFVDNMSGQDSLSLRKRIQDVRPDVVMRQPFQCELCGHTEGEVDVEITSEFFWPKSGS